MPCLGATGSVCTGYSSQTAITEALIDNPALVDIVLGAIGSGSDYLDLSWTGGEPGASVEFIVYDITLGEINHYTTALVSALLKTPVGIGLVVGRQYLLHYRVITATHGGDWLTEVITFASGVTAVEFIVDGADYVVDGANNIIE